MMRRFLLITGYFLLLVFGIFLIIRSYQHVMLVPALFGLFLVLSLLLFAIFRLTIYRALRGPRARAVMEFFRCMALGIRPSTLLNSLPLFAAGLFFLLILLNLRHATPWAVNLGHALRYWYLNEGLALFLAPFLVWIFARDDSTPVWQRVVSIPVVLMFFGGFMFFVKIMQQAWAFLLLRGAQLYFQRPDDEEQAIGCLQVILDIILLVVLGVILVNRRDYAYGSLESLPPGLRAMGASMLFGCVYFFALGVAGILFRPFIYAIPPVRPKEQRG